MKQIIMCDHRTFRDSREMTELLDHTPDCDSKVAMVRSLTKNGWEEQRETNMEIRGQRASLGGTCRPHTVRDGLRMYR